MKLLILGGTVFLGRHLVDAALTAGHEVTLLNRGSRDVGFSQHAEQLRGDRDSDLSVLNGRRFDAVVDCSGYTPMQLQRTADALGERVSHYVFVSSISVHARFPPGHSYDETAPVTEDTGGYGGGKARAEEVIEVAFPGRVTHLRPGLIVGPYDPSGRFSYWPMRVARGGSVLAPGRPNRPVQFIDVRDLALWCLQLAQQRRAGVFHAVGPQGSMADLLDACLQTCGSDARFVWCDDEDLVRANVTPWTGLPLWIPESDPDYGGMLLARGQRAAKAGLLTRPWIETVADTLAWALRAGGAAESPAALKPDDEAVLLTSLSKVQSKD